MINLTDFQYYIINTQLNDDFQIDISNQVYTAWKEIWNQVFQEKNQSVTVNKDDFFRQKIIAAVFDRDELVAFHLYTFFNLKRSSSKEHSYFSHLQTSSIERMNQLGLQNIMSMEYLTVMPKYRGDKKNRWGEMMISLGQRLALEMHADACFGTARTDVKVNKMGENLGFQILQDPLQKYDYTCEVMYSICGTAIPLTDPSANLVAEHLWTQKIDNQTQKIKLARVA